MEKARTRRSWDRQLRNLQNKPRWNKVRGPIGATIATWLDIGWKPEKPDKFTAPDGTAWNFEGNVGEFFWIEFRDSIILQLWKKAAEHWHGKGAEKGLDLTTAKRKLKSLKLLKRKASI